MFLLGGYFTTTFSSYFEKPKGSAEIGLNARGKTSKSCFGS